MKQKRKNSIRMALLMDQGGRCYYCDEHIHPAAATLDHIVPRALGGKDRRDNFVVACQPCNVTRGVKNIYVFRESVRRPPSVEDDT